MANPSECANIRTFGSIRYSLLDKKPEVSASLPRRESLQGLPAFFPRSWRGTDKVWVVGPSVIGCKHLVPSSPAEQRFWHWVVRMRAIFLCRLRRRFVFPPFVTARSLSGRPEPRLPACCHAGSGRPLFCLFAFRFRLCLDYILISTSTPAGRFKLISASIVRGVGSTMSIKRLWIRISYCSRESLWTNVERLTV